MKAKTLRTACTFALLPLLATFSLAAADAPKVGSNAPDFTLKTIGLKDVSLRSFRGKNVVLLFYPLDWTPG